MKEFWEHIHIELQAGYRVILMYVLRSEGSSPGRQGFKMGVSESGKMYGSIGGGFMEHKLVELCKKDLLKRDFQPFIKHQIHQASVAKDKSGMICSGEQTITFYQLRKNDISLISSISSAIRSQKNGFILSDNQGISFQLKNSLPQKFELTILGENDWVFKEDISHAPELHIIGGGHISLPLSEFAHSLGFKISVYDDRENLNTVERNRFAQFILVKDYQDIHHYLKSGENKYVVLMSFGYRTDKIILKQLLKNDFTYLGMLGSKEKVKQLFKEMLAEGVEKNQLEKVYSPIGLSISSKTPEEIAISILAEIIQVKNRS